MRGNMHLQVISSLDGRKQVVCFGGNESTYEKIEAWVPQKFEVRAVFIPNTYK